MQLFGYLVAVVCLGVAVAYFTQSAINWLKANNMWFKEIDFLPMDYDLLEECAGYDDLNWFVLHQIFHLMYRNLLGCDYLNAGISTNLRDYVERYYCRKLTSNPLSYPMVMLVQNSPLRES